ncbi:hypothetical protein Clacol_001981 [Clathrus columnatus]|uniref:Uncharacterized protein n=1 Tax=Clathrus columnatus TaxID=1419009 RepID=A0AAV5A596_9AGAM|nr:hypothetical protein Clacol_001981 [Clathrus columnatus]
MPRFPLPKKLPTLNTYQITFFGKISQEPWTKDWVHLRDVSKGEKTQLKRRPDYKAGIFKGLVPVKDRIKQWNVIPGDLVRVRGEGDTIQEVFGINKFKNLVYLKGHTGTNPTSATRNIPSIHYSKCQLYIGDHEYPPPVGETKPIVKQVFALDLRCTAPRWAPYLGRYNWIRYAVRTSPPLPGQEYEKLRIPIPWPKHEKPPPLPIQDCDTPAEVVKEVTWKPTRKFYPAQNVGKKKLLEDGYLHHIRPPPEGVPVTPYDPEMTPPMEYVISDELSNKHGGARKRQRAMDREKENAVRKEAFIKAEMADLDGRTKREALKEAEFKWAETRRKEMQEQRKKLWIKRGGLARLKRKHIREVRKARKEQDQLRNLVLPPAANQIVPPSQPSL